MVNLRPEMQNAPRCMSNRPIDHRGFYVPWFVTEKTEDGHWDFVRIQASRVRQAMEEKLCFVSGTPLGKYSSFVVGPMCTINRVGSDMACRREVAQWAAKVCPFLTRPLAVREHVPDHVTPGNLDTGNPGCAVVWTGLTRNILVMRNNLIRIPPATSVEFYKEGQLATKGEARHFMKVGARKLMALAEQETETINRRTVVDECSLMVAETVEMLEKMGCL